MLFQYTEKMITDQNAKSEFPREQQGMYIYAQASNGFQSVYM